jgi:AbrB family looped-hinge helix DNA binding protein
MEEATLTSKGQLTLPKSMREALGVRAGDRIRFVPARNGYRLVVVKRDLRSLAGFLAGRRKSPLTTAGMNRAVAEMGVKEEPAD